MNLSNVVASRDNKKVYRDGDTAVKIFDENFSKSDILNEALNQARVEETGITIPKLKKVSMIDGKWAISSEFISGKTLLDLMKENPNNIDYYLNQFVDLQISVHKHKAPLLNKLRDKLNRKINQANINETSRYELCAKLKGMPKHDKVCHGDFMPSNIIISDNDNRAYIIDWSHATQGNASADVAITYLKFLLNNSEEIADKYLDLFCKKTNTEKQYVQKWFPIVAASQSIKCKESELDFLLKWVNIVEYQ